jgi:predicted PurR-regulated permease PerM
MDFALSSYIQGQIIVSICVGILAYIAFLIIGLDYPLVLALVAMFTNVIPFIGPWIGTIPAVIVGLLNSPFMALLVVLAVVVVQQIESNLISPQVMGRKLSIHPLTIIFLLLVAGRFAGLLGLILAVPTYAVGKVLVLHIYRLWVLRNTTID